MFNKKIIRPSKHQASKKGFRHQRNLSKGELNSLKNKKFHTAKEIILLKSLGIDVL